MKARYNGQVERKARFRMGLRTRIFSRAEALFYRSGRTFDTVFGRCRRSFFIGFYAGGSRLCFRLRVGPYGGLSLCLSSVWRLSSKAAIFLWTPRAGLRRFRGFPASSSALPELIVSCIGAARGTNALAIGNAVGSVTANTGLIMAISIICIPAVIKRSQYALKSILLLAATTILYLASFGKGFSLWGSILLLLIFAVAMIDNVRGAKKESVACEKMPLVKKEIPINVAKFILGAAGIVFGAEFLVDSATELAVVSGVSQAVISATIVAIGTSLPELVTTVTAIVKKQSSLSVGNIIGANLIDITIILPICSFISADGLASSAQNLYLDIPVCLGLLAIAIVPMLIRKKFSKVQGFVMLGIYLTYIVVMALFNPFPAVL